MATEVERKFLVANDLWRRGARGVSCTQGYLAPGPPAAIRVRIMGDKATLNIKSATMDVTRDEFEYAIPLADARHILEALCTGHLIEKTRYRVDHGGFAWDVDVFGGVNEGLIVAEIELEHAEQPFDRPSWLGSEVSDDPRYFNSNLTQHPYAVWAEREA
ncbi:MAG TPA: CYTH domain-containing protein [Candidatus Hydrogenedentes bacterium]|nr:CYTH domain-containing protein [Candidatus Hydrogenedentota bacterium]